MSVMEILKIPNPKLKKVSEPVTEVDANVRRILDDMADTLYEAKGVGLSAPQIGILKRLVVIDVSRGDIDEEGNKIKDKNPLYLINPEIIETSKEQEMLDEGCLSVPDEWGEVKRHCQVTVKYLDRSGREQTLTADGLLGQCLQHEIDHLDGIVFIDRLSKMKRDIILRRAKRKEFEKKHYND